MAILAIRLLIWYQIVSADGLTLPPCIEAHAIYKHNLAKVAESLELYKYPDGNNRTDVRMRYHQLADHTVRLADINNFFFMRVEDTNLHIVALRTKTSPYIEYSHMMMWCTAGELRDYWRYQHHVTKIIYRIYDNIDDLHRDIPWHWKLDKLARLKEDLGEENYKNGIIPPPTAAGLTQR
jgi:hypothetical protein